MTLSEELRRLADATPPIPVDPDLWSRARARRRRDRALVGVAALAVAGVVVAATVLPGGTTEPQPAGSSLVVTQESGPASDDLAVGTARAAHVADDGSAVVLGTDGVQHVLRLPGRSGPVALSPDGTRLAWFDASSRPAQVRQVDLRSGGQSAASARRVVEVDQLRWGQDGSLVFSGRDTDGAARAGRLGRGASITGGLATGPDPLLGLLTNGDPVALSGDEVTKPRPAYSSGAPEVRVVSSNTDPVVGLCTRGFSLTFLSQAAGGALTAWTYDVRLGQTGEARQTLPDDLLGSPAADLDPQVLGCLPGTEVLAADRLLLRTEGARAGEPDALGVLTLGPSPTWEVVGEVADDVPTLTVATNLVQRPEG